MENAVRSFMEKHKLLHRGAKVLVGVSGGPDSMALLYLLIKMSREWELEIHVLSVDHQLRGDDSKADFNYVKQVSANWGIPFHGTTVDVHRYAEENGVSIEVAARKLRYQFFAEKMEALDGDYLALGHHGDDQVETLLMKLVRSASSTAFSGIPVTRPLGGGLITRPLLAVTKQDIEAYCKENGISPRIDATNLESNHTRNYFRHHVTPLLKEKNGNIHRTAQLLSETLQEDEAFLRKEAEKVVQESVTFGGDQRRASLEIKLFKKHDQPLQRRAFHLILNYLYETLPGQLSYVHEEQFFALMNEDTGNAQLDFPQMLKLNRAYDRLTFYFEHSYPPSASFHHTLTIPGRTYLPKGSLITATYTAAREKESPFSLYVAANAVTFPLHVRTRENGDRMSWTGLQGTKKLKDIFIDAKIPIQKRNEWPIVVDDAGTILWVIGLKKGKQLEVNAEQFVYIQYEKGNQ